MNALISPLDALRLMVAHYPGGRGVIAARLGKPDEVLRKELSGAVTHKFGVVDACIVASMCADAQSPHAEAYATSVAACSGGFVQLAHGPAVDPHQAHRSVCAVVREASDVASASLAALVDGDVSANEMQEVRHEVEQAISALQHHLLAVEACHLQGQQRRETRQ